MDAQKPVNSDIIPPSIQEDIHRRIKEIEDKEQVLIFYACESGSRAWGFPSSNSDYDVRFLYTHHPDWYLAIDLELKRDVIERPINDDLDLSGWDIRKALQLFRKSNPPLLEWLNSPIVYRTNEIIIDRWKSMITKVYSPKASFYHYLHMAQGNNRSYLQGDFVWIKKYFYVLRPLFAMQWIERKSTPVPMKFDVLVQNLIENAEIKNVIEQLVRDKKAGKELDKGPRIDVLSDYLNVEMERLAKIAASQTPSKPPVQELNTFFRWVFGRAVPITTEVAEVYH